MKKILIVDDVIINREILIDILEPAGYVCDTATNGAEAMEMLEAHRRDYGLVLLDIIMPVMDGFDVLESMGERGWLDSIPAVVITGEESVEVETRALELNAADHIRKPFDDTVVLKRVNNIFDLYSYRRSLEKKVADATRELRTKNEVLAAQSEQIALFNENIVDFLGTVVEYRHTESGQHVKRVKSYSELLCHAAFARFPEYGLDDEVIDRIARASVLHDMGKVAIPDSILLKPGRLTEEEYNAMKDHTVLGADLIMEVKGAWDDEFRDTAYQICRHHHERWDGCGYPDGLAGDDIPFAAQVVSIADVYDALVEDRVYKKAFSHEKAIEMILGNECGVFNPNLMECLRAVEADFARVAATEVD